MRNTNRRYLPIVRESVHDMLGIRWAEGENNSGGGTGPAGDSTSQGGDAASSANTDGATGGSANKGDDKSRDVTVTGTADAPKPADTSKLEKALASERESRKAAEQSAKDKQAEADRATKAQQEQLDALAKALGFKKDDVPPDPEALQRAVAERDARLTDVQAEKDREIAARDDTIRAKDVELAAYRAAALAGANVGALMDSRAFLLEVSKLDPADDGFAKGMTAAVKAAMDANPAYRINQTATAAQAGIGSAGTNGNDAAVTPGAGRLRAAYSTP